MQKQQAKTTVSLRQYFDLDNGCQQDCHEKYSSFNAKLYFHNSFPRAIQMSYQVCFYTINQYYITLVDGVINMLSLHAIAIETQLQLYE